MAKLMKDKVGIITAGGIGIGRASALAFAEEGAKVVVSDISVEHGEETVRLITENGGEAIFVKCNVANEDEVKSLVNTAIDTYGRLDWAHNNAGVGVLTRPITESETADWERVFNVNILGMFYCLKYEIKAMLKTGGGSIVNTASTSGITGAAGLSAYSTTKFGVNGMTKSTALEFGKQGIRINSICPGMTLTDSVRGWKKDAPEQAQEFEDAIPMGRMGTPEEQANAAVFLCSDKASFITGVNLAVDGGETAQ